MSATRTDLAILHWFNPPPPAKRQRIERFQCNASTKQGSQCKSMGQHSRFIHNLCSDTVHFCHAHSDRFAIVRDKRSQCIAQTKKGAQCRNLCITDHCYLHRVQGVRPSTARAYTGACAAPNVERRRCIANTEKGVQCKIMCTTGHCHVHRAQVIRQFGWRNVCRRAGVPPVLSSAKELYEVLLEVDTLKKHACTSLQLIAEFGVGDVKPCEYPSCQGEIFFLSTHFLTNSALHLYKEFDMQKPYIYTSPLHPYKYNWQTPQRELIGRRYECSMHYSRIIVHPWKLWRRRNRTKIRMIR